MSKPQRKPPEPRQYFLLVSCADRRIEYSPDGEGLFRILLIVPDGHKIRGSLGNNNDWSAGSLVDGCRRYNRVARGFDGFREVFNVAFSVIIKEGDQVLLGGNIQADLLVIVRQCVEGHKRNS